MPRSEHQRVDGVITAEAARLLKPDFDPQPTLARVEDLIVAAARDGREEVNALPALPGFDSALSSHLVQEYRALVTLALRNAGYTVDYYAGGHHGVATYTVSWSKK